MDLDDSNDQLALLSLCMRWIAHDFANPLSAVLSGLEMGEAGADLVQRGSDQLAALTRCLGLIAAATRDPAAQGQTQNAGEDSFKPLQALARGRDVALKIHLSSDGLARAKAGLLTAFTLPVIGWTMAGGKIFLHSRKDQFVLEAFGLSEKKAHHIKELLERQSESSKSSDPADMPLYLAILACRRLNAQTKIKIGDDQFSLAVDFPADRN